MPFPVTRRCCSYLALLVATALSPKVSLAETSLPAIRHALAAKNFRQAAQLADQYLAAEPAHPDQARYLKALALFDLGEHAQAVEAADGMLTKHADSAWQHKAVFLKATALLQLRRYEEAETIYSTQARRLLDAKRKHTIAGVVVRFADALATEPAANDLDAPKPDFQRSYNLYKQVLSMEIDRSLRDTVMFKAAGTIAKLGNHRQAIEDFRAYLAEFDPDWTGPVGSVERMRGQKKENPPVAGQNILKAYQRLIESQLAAGQLAAARQNAEDLIRRFLPEQLPQLAGQAKSVWRDAHWQIVRSYQLPNPQAQQLPAAVQAAQKFLDAAPDHSYSVVAAWWIAQAYQNHGRSDAAIAAYQAVLQGVGYQLPAGEAAAEKLSDLKKSPLELKAAWSKQALFTIGQIRLAQKNYAEATQRFADYVRRWPHGPQWSAAQQQLINIEFLQAIDAVENNRHDDARARFHQFLSAHPLDARAAQVHFLLGQLHVAHAEHLAQEDREQDKKQHTETIAAAHREAIGVWEHLVSKYPNTEQSSLALYRIGMIYEEQLGDLAQALAAYRRLTWGSHASAARGRIAVMTQKHLDLLTERKFHTDETVRVRLSTRNIETLTIKQYWLDLEAYFRKTHHTTGVESLDIALIEPDKTWEIKVNGYAKYQPLTQAVEIPFDENQPGVCIINISEDDLEATTLVIRSDLDVVLQASRREALTLVQNMRTGQPAVGAKVLLSDGKAVFATGATGDDGVFRGTFEELKDVEKLRVFAIQEGQVASNLGSLKGLQRSTGLTRKGYLYTDRPAYQPGQTVHLRGVLREVKDGSYHIAAGAKYDVSLVDPRGRVLHEETLTLSKFGTFALSAPLDQSSATGKYTIQVRPHQKTSPVDSSHFLVQPFQLQKMELAIDLAQSVVFRGETVQATIRATYAWGQPVSEQAIRYTLPDGRVYVEKTDAQGELTIEFDTSGVTPPQTLKFSATIEGENVTARQVVHLPHFGFNLQVKPAQPLILSGESLDVVVTASAPDGAKIAQPVRLVVLRREASKPHPVLSQVPWLRRPALPAVEVTVEEHQLKTDAKTGQATLRLTLNEGANYLLRVTGEDRFGQTVSTQSRVTVSDEKDATKLRLFTDRDTLKVGSQATARLHSRLDQGLALLTWEGETILNYRVVPFSPGYTPIRFDVDHAQFPNFRLAATVMDGRRLHTAQRDYQVERELKITVKPIANVFRPDSPGRVELLVTDQLDRPVEADLSLALVQEALYAMFPERVPSILPFFQRDARRHAEFRLMASNGFTYQAITQNVIEEVLEEEERLVRQNERQEELAQARQKLDRLREVGGPRLREVGGPGFSRSSDGRFQGSMATPKPNVSINESNYEPFAENSRFLSDSVSEAAAQSDRSESHRESIGRATLAPRRELPSAGYWLASVVTDEQGLATVEVPMPETTTKWRITTRGVSTETLVGQATTHVITRKDFFVNLKTPRSLVEGDKVRLLGRVHNLTDYAGPVELELTLTSGQKKFQTLRETVEIAAQGTAEVLFAELEIPEVGRVTTTVLAVAGEQRDAVARSLPVRPWGLEYASSDGGVADSTTAVFLELPKGLEYRGRELSITIGADLKQQVIAMALGGRPVPVIDDGRAVRRIALPIPGQSPGSELLAAASGLAYAQAVDATQVDQQRLTHRVRALVGSVVATQRDDGGWSWHGNATDLFVTATNYWAMVEARRLGVVRQNKPIEQAERYLRKRFQHIGASDYDAKAAVLFALSTGGKADYRHANSLYRERNRLAPLALAHTALALASLDRMPMARELVALLYKKIEPVENVVPKRASVAGTDRRHYHHWLSSRQESTALALLTLMRVQPESPQIAELAVWLLSDRGCHGWQPAKARGPVLAALGAYFARGKFAEHDYRLKILVNDQLVTTLTRRGDAAPLTISVPTEQIAPGENTIKFELEGQGSFAYAATLTGFSSQFKDPNSWQYPRPLWRTYFHDRLRYRGVPINTNSSSPVKHLAIGQRTRVQVYLDNRHFPRYYVIEEPLPAGATLVPGSLQGNFAHHELEDGRLVLYYQPNKSPHNFHYELVGYGTGTYRVGPTILRDVMRPGQMRLGKPSTLHILPPNVESDDPYQMNDGERFVLGRHYFNDGLDQQAINHLWPLFDRKHKYQEREVARMLLWVYTSEKHYDARKAIAAFEVLSVRHPQLVIPFDKILVVGQAYHDLGEFERAWLVYKATIDSSFICDSSVAALLEDNGQLLGSIDYQENLWWRYPDTPQVVAAHLALSQLLYEKSAQADELAKQDRQVRIRLDVPPQDPQAKEAKVTKASMLAKAIRLLDEFLAMYPKNPLADDAAFSLTNAYLELEDYSTVVELAGVFAERYAGSKEFATGFQYMAALGYFWQRDYAPALKAAQVVAGGQSKDRDYARYILGQIYHAQDQAKDAIHWYDMVRKQYADAREAIDYFREKRVALDEVYRFLPGKPVKFDLKYRNIAEAQVQVFKVDLMKLYLREKNLSRIAQVNLAGIEPEAVLKLSLGDGHDYVDQTRPIKLDLKDEGAYLVICRGDDLFASTLVLVTPLKLEVQEDSTSGRVRVNVVDEVRKLRPSGVHVKAIGTADKTFRGGESDLRGLVVADGVRGVATVIARDQHARYAFYRGTTWLGAPKDVAPPKSRPQQEADESIDYRRNLELQNSTIQHDNYKGWDKLRRGGQKGVRIQQAQ